ncbi:DnaD domain protein [Bacillus carboniphilus]|uniref:DnaD domain protein n=1 Tax=Bacillus carboniphilus TaxID=86663 RepID=A0ABN0WDA5_9BACI
MEVRHWTELVPGDTYQIQASGLIQPVLQRVVSLLYQPLIGSTATALYTTLLSELEENRTQSKRNYHHFLMAVLNIPLKDIFKARLKLEGIGLLRTYRSKVGEEPMYVYELQPPLSPQSFFHDSMMSYYLQRKLGDHHFDRLKDYFKVESILDSSSHEEMTRSFHEVFTSSTSQAPKAITPDENVDEENWIDMNEGQAPKVRPANFSLDLFYGGLSDNFIKTKSITPQVEETILKLAYIYNLSPLDMQKVLLEAIDEHQEVDLEELRKAAKSWYELQKGKNLPNLIHRKLPSEPQKGKQVEKPKKLTKEEELIRYLSEVTPKQFLTDQANGHEPTKSDLDLIETIMVEQGLEPGVINVLLYYVLLKQDMRLTKTYVQKIAGHWARKNIRTVKEAFEFAKQENQKFQNQKQSSTRKTSYKTTGKKESLPDWFEEERKRRKEVAVAATKFDDFDFELERRKLEEELKKK